MSGHSPCRRARTARRCTSGPTSTGTRRRYLREAQAGKAWSWSILRPVLIVGCSVGSAMNVIPALGVAADDGAPARPALDYPGGVGRVAQAVDADLLARAVAWSGEAKTARNEIFNVTNGDVFVWPNVLAGHRRRAGLRSGRARAASSRRQIRPQEAAWAEIRAAHGLKSGDSRGSSSAFRSSIRRLHDRATAATGPVRPRIVSTIKLMQAGFGEVMDTEAMFASFAEMQAKRLLPRALKKSGPDGDARARRPGPSTPSKRWRDLCEAVGNLLEAGLGLVGDVADLVVALDPLAGRGRHLGAAPSQSSWTFRLPVMVEVDDGQEAELDQPSRRNRACGRWFHRLRDDSERSYRLCRAFRVVLPDREPPVYPFLPPKAPTARCSHQAELGGKIVRGACGDDKPGGAPGD